MGGGGGGGVSEVDCNEHLWPQTSHSLIYDVQFRLVLKCAACHVRSLFINTPHMVGGSAHAHMAAHH